MKSTSIITLALALAAAALYGLHIRPATAVSPSDVAFTRTVSNNAPGLAGSQSKVSIKSWFPGPHSSDGQRPVSIRLKIADGWHVNAHPPSLPFLVATTVKAKAAGNSIPIKVTYPPGRASGIMLKGTDIKVYQSNTTLNAQLPPAAVQQASKAGFVTLLVQVQACSDKGICLPPANIHSRLPWM